MSLSMSLLARNEAGDAIVDLIDNGSIASSGYIEIRTGAKPATPQITASGSLLVTLPLSNPAFGLFNNGVCSSNSIASATTIDTGIAGWFRIYDRDGHAIVDGDITVNDGGGDIQFDDINFLIGGTVNISGITASMPA